MTSEQTRKLTNIQNYRTRYEAIIEATDGRQALLAYTARHSKRGLCEALTNRGEAVVRFLGLPSTAQFKIGRSAISIDGGAIIRFTGRTQRDAILSGELPYVATQTEG